MNRSSVLFASLLACASLSAQTTILFQNAPDLAANFTTSGVTTSSTVSIVNGSSSPASALTGDAIRVSDTGADRPQLRYQATSPLNNGLILSFDGKLVTGSSSNIMFRLGPDASTLVTSINNSVVGIQLAPSGSVVAEQSSNITYSSAFTLANPFSITIYYNNSATALDFTAQGGPATLASNTWALYVNGTQKGTGLSERNALDLSSGFGMVWASGTTGGATMDFQLDNIQVTTIPDPATYAALFGAASLGLVFARRRIGRR